MKNIYPWIIATVMLIVLIGTGAAVTIIGDLGKVLGGLGIILGILIILGIIFAGFNKK